MDFHYAVEFSCCYPGTRVEFFLGFCVHDEAMYNNSKFYCHQHGIKMKTNRVNVSIVAVLVYRRQYQTATSQISYLESALELESGVITKGSRCYVNDLRPNIPISRL